jgi:hypothetical protein
MDEKVKNVAAEEARQLRDMTKDAVQSRAYLVRTTQMIPSSPFLAAHY